MDWSALVSSLCARRLFPLSSSLVMSTNFPQILLRQDILLDAVNNESF